jgi:RNA-directed DNA polymerase
VNQSQATPETSSEGPFKGYVRLDWIRSAAGRQRKEGFRLHNLMHHLSAQNLRQAFRELDGSRACGVDGVTKSQYQQDLEANLEALHNTLRGGGWRPRPSREVLIPKPQGGFRPLAIGCLEDKIVQTLVSRILEAIYDPQFHRHSYGFRRGKSAHQAIGRLYKVITERRHNCVVVEMDIEKFFNSVNHEWLLRQLGQRISDPHFLRLIHRLLRSSILHEDGSLADNERGTPQGSPVSPVLANICLHYLLDEWFAEHYSDKGEFVRYADDAVFVFKNEADAQSFQAALVERMKEASLNLNLDKSGIVSFNSKAPRGVIPFLGLELYWGYTKEGSLRTLKLKTSTKKLGRGIDAFTDWIKAARNRKPLNELWRTAAAKLRGHFLYFGLSFNQLKLKHFYRACIEALYKWLNRRSQKRSFSWERFKARLRHMPLPKPPFGYELIDVTSEHRTERKHQPKSRMRETRTSGSERSAGRQRPAFT